ncbi:hypothetical protein DLJ53_02110 [Acuticoccus sediminis]|uniref:Uncharacterized protein n=1 Tax=Acuticoccus sediminis TaxID=2184697 RepID=A0A8B2P048_9HYPH|nr:hypothetical protein [Acuticoccus sediminis]RAI03334.1 hypothetical protein DLJ53_02110 [Acuticoccus sediminis]
MFAIWGLTAQIIMISIAFPTACLAASAVATLVIFGIDPATLGASTWPQIVHLSFVILSMTLGAVVTSFWPAMIAATVTEGFKLRSLLAYLITGAVVGLVRVMPVTAAVSGEAMPLDTAAAQLSIACGAIGGLVYWAIAGRSAGRWLELPWFEERRWR